MTYKMPWFQVKSTFLWPLVTASPPLGQEAKQTGSYYQSVQTRISGSYTHHYRQVLPELLDVLQFRSNNDQYQPLIDALSVITAYLDATDPYYPTDEDIPLETSLRKLTELIQTEKWKMF